MGRHVCLGRRAQRVVHTFKAFWRRGTSRATILFPYKTWKAWSDRGALCTVPPSWKYICAYCSFSTSKDPQRFHRGCVQHPCGKAAKLNAIAWLLQFADDRRRKMKQQNNRACVHLRVLNCKPSAKAHPQEKSAENKLAVWNSKVLP